jgi:uncharacterized protein
MDRRALARQLGDRARIPGGLLQARSVGGEVVFSGYGSSTGQPYPMGWHDEVLARGAFTDTLAARPDVSFLIGHDGIPYARTTSRACPLELREDGFGLAFDAHTDVSRYPAMQEIAHAVEDGLLYQCSFAFRVVDQEWDEDYKLRTIRAVDLDRGDVSIVTNGANPNTPVSVSARHARTGPDLDFYRARAYALKLHGDADRTDARLSRRSLHAAKQIADELRRNAR